MHEHLDSEKHLSDRQESLLRQRAGLGSEPKVAGQHDGLPDEIPDHEHQEAAVLAGHLPDLVIGQVSEGWRFHASSKETDEPHAPQDIASPFNT